MRKDFHETYRHDKIKPPLERSTGLVFAAVALIAAALWRNSPVVPWIALGVATLLAALSLLAPRILRPLNLIWFQIGLLLHLVVNPLVMLAMFAVVFVPGGLTMRIWRDPLRRCHAKPGATFGRAHLQHGIDDQPVLKLPLKNFGGTPGWWH